MNKEFKDLKLIIGGYGGHGKDEVCRILKEKTGLTYAGSSWTACEFVVYPKIKDIFNYETPQMCFEDRRNHRELWFNLICEFNENDLSRLGKIIFSKNNVYCGIRNIHELNSIQENRLIDCFIWVDASKRMPNESDTSCTVNKEDSDYVLDNNGTLQDLDKEIDKLLNYLSDIKKDKDNGWHKLIISKELKEKDLSTIFANDSSPMNRIEKEGLLGELGSPKMEQGMSDNDYLKRVSMIKISNVCCVYKDFRIVKNHSIDDSITITAKVKPVGPKGEILKELINNKSDIKFGFRKLGDTSDVTSLITFDLIN